MLIKKNNEKATYNVIQNYDHYAFSIYDVLSLYYLFNHIKFNKMKKIIKMLVFLVEILPELIELLNEVKELVKDFKEKQNETQKDN